MTNQVEFQERVEKNMQKNTQPVRFWRSLRGRLIIAFLLVAIIPSIAVGYFAYQKSSLALSDQATSKLVAIRDVKAIQIEKFFNDRLIDARTLAQTPSTAASVKALCNGCHEDMLPTDYSESQSFNLYRGLYLGQPEIIQAGDYSQFSAAHAIVHPLFHNYLEAYNYTDIYLVDTHHGKIIYSVGKRDDYGTHIKKGTYANTNFNAVFRKAESTDDVSYSVLEDFAFYEPSNGAASFVASPVYDGGEKIAVLVLQIPIDQINAIMGERSGLGQTGETYLVGEDLLMRSDSRFSETSTIFTQKVDTESARKALDSQTGTELIVNYRDATVLSAYKPLAIEGVNWAIVAEVDQAEAFEPARQMQLVTMSTSGIAALFVLFIAIAIANLIARPLQEISSLAKKIAEKDLPYISNEINLLAAGDLTRTLSIESKPVPVKSKDEIGEMQQAFNAMISQFHGMGKSFSDMTANLRDLVGQVAGSAEAISTSSSHLATAANQAGLATGQISSTLQQVAQGIAQQSESVSNTATAVEQTNRAVEMVARGADKQDKAVTKTSVLTGEMSAVITQVSSSAVIQAQGAEESVQTARTSATTVQETVQSMQNIKVKVDLTAQRVLEMGNRSNQIGDIIETIGDLAAQTNLLALNAAIEAARAGEHGKGFAVVAGEVRRLAQKSNAATKEIASLVKSIQGSVREAVQAMQDSASEVDRGVANADRASLTLEDVMKAIETSKKSGDEIAAAARRMDLISTELVKSMGSVSGVVLENTQATRDMSRSTDMVTVAIENIASVSAQNSAAVEEVAASTEEMSAQVQEVTVSAQSLADMAEELQQMVSRFKLNDSLNIQPAHTPNNGRMQMANHPSLKPVLKDLKSPQAREKARGVTY